MMISAEEWWVNIKSLNDNQKYWGRARTRGFVKLGFCWVISLFVCYSASHLPLWLSSNQGRVLSSARPYLSTKGSGRRWEHSLLLCLVEPVCLLTKYDGKRGCCTSHLWGEMVCRCVSRSDHLVHEPTDSPQNLSTWQLCNILFISITQRCHPLVIQKRWMIF